jgi:hypothetical protein
MDWLQVNFLCCADLYLTFTQSLIGSETDRVEITCDPEDVASHVSGAVALHGMLVQHLMVA